MAVSSLSWEIGAAGSGGRDGDGSGELVWAAHAFAARENCGAAAGGARGDNVSACGDRGASLERPQEVSGDAAVQLLCVREICAAPGGAPAGICEWREYSGWSEPGARARRFQTSKLMRCGVVVGGQMPWSSHPFLKIGQRVRIRSGALDGTEGILVSRNGDRTLVISVDAIQRSLAVRVEGYEVEAV